MPLPCSYLVTNILKIDDPVEAIAVHMWSGMWGVLSVSPAARPGPCAAARVWGPPPGTRSFLVQGQPAPAKHTCLCARAPLVLPPGHPHHNLLGGLNPPLQVGLFATEEYVAQAYGTKPGTEDGVRYYGGFYGGGGRLFAAQVGAPLCRAGKSPNVRSAAMV